MTTGYVLVLMHYDRSGVIQCFGPYDTETRAERARDELKAMPAIESGEWDIKPCTDLGAPKFSISPVSPNPYTAPCAPTPGWPSRRDWNEVTITCDMAGA